MARFRLYAILSQKRVHLRRVVRQKLAPATETDISPRCKIV
jgi:hypothetical protein